MIHQSARIGNESKQHDQRNHEFVITDIFCPGTTMKYSTQPAHNLALLVVAVGLVPIRNEQITSHVMRISRVVALNAALLAALPLMATVCEVTGGAVAAG
jgi:hypothetical protein